ncbi:MAG: hypothetical protein JW751_18655 [Polyangiaceae bacterium]|nr:hypothetical protein [Polyangiaceae bacterium]
MTRLLRSFLFPSLVVAYVCLMAIAAGAVTLWPWIAAVTLPLVLSEVWRRTRRPADGEDRIEPAARAALRTTAWGAAMWFAARTGLPGVPSLDAAANVGVGTAAVGALVALARIGSFGGVLSPHPLARSFDAAAFVGILWGIAVAVPVTRAVVPARMIRLDPLAIDYATTTAAAGTLLVFVIASLRAHQLRRLELGVSERSVAALAIALTALIVTVPAALLDVTAPDRLLPIGALVTALFMAWTATASDAATIAAVLRGTLAVVMLGAPTVLVTALFARAMPERAGTVVLVGTATAIAVGLIARAVARPLGPEQSRWLDAIDAASRGALQPDPESALRATLEALSQATATASGRPEVWRADPEAVLSVDVAGYLHTSPGSAPPRLYEIAVGEPERTLRVEALKAVEVRRPEVRPLLAWFEARDGFSATLIIDDAGPEGFILLPRGSRTVPMTLEEARAVRLLADRLSALAGVASALARSRERERAALDRAAALETDQERLLAAVRASAARHRHAAERVARPLRRSRYSPAARMALESATTVGPRVSSLTLLAPPGTDAAAWAACIHLAGPQSDGPLVVVDGANGSEHEPLHWQDREYSPIALARGGSLVVLDVAALPEPIQELLAVELTREEAAATGSGLPAARMIVSAREPVETLREARRLALPLARRLGDAVVHLPSLAERGEDLRALILDELAAAGIRARGTPLGIDGQALRMLIDHDWPGNEAELRAVLASASLVAAGPLVTVGDLASSGFRLEPAADRTDTPVPVAEVRRRARTRAPRQR